MIKCPKCGSDNLLNAIFCRCCGEKLDLSELKPDSFLEKKLTKSQKIMKIVNQVLSVVIALLLITLIVGIFFPVAHLTGNEPSADATKQFEEAQTFGVQAVRRGRRPPRNKDDDKPSSKSFTFSSQDATALLNKSLHLPITGGDNKLTSENLSVSFAGDGCATLILTSKLMGKVPMHNTVVVKPTVSNGVLAMNVQKTKIGFVPVPAQLNQKITQKFVNLSGGSTALDKIKSKLTEVKISDGSLTITVSKK